MSKRKTRRTGPSASPLTVTNRKQPEGIALRRVGGSSGDPPAKMQKAEANSAPVQPTGELSIYWQYALVLLVILFIAGVRIRLLSFPLERDEGEYAYAGQLILQGIPPYELAYNMKLPGTYYAYAAILRLFGQTPSGVHLGLLIVNVAATFLIFLLTKRMFGGTAGVVACASYGLLSLTPAVLGFAGHATHFVVLPSVAGLLLLLAAIDSKKLWQLFASGALLCLGFLAKQPGIFFFMFAGLYLLWSEGRQPLQLRNLISRAAAFGLGASFPFVVVCMILYRAGVIGKFWFWTFSYAREYGSIVTLAEGMDELSNTFPHLLIQTVGIWILAVAGLYFVLTDQRLRTHAVFGVGFLVFSFFAVSAGFYYRPHYYVLMLPAVAVLAGAGVSSTARACQRASRRVFRFMPAALVLVCLGFSIFVLRQYFFEVDPALACKLLYGLEPFPEALNVGQYIKNHTAETARIVVMGSEPEIYFYSHRHSATGYIYMYALLERQKYALTMQREMIREIEAAQPEFLVVVKGPPQHWGMTVGSETMIFDWARKFVDEHYSLTGAVDVSYPSNYWWDSDVKNAKFTSPINVMVFKRRS